MKYASKKPARLILEDGTVFTGNSIGRVGTSGGEICFYAGMAGHQEIFTDPSSFGNILVTSAAHIGNCGVSVDEQDFSETYIAGLVVNSFTETPGQPGGLENFQKFLEDSNIVGICDIDTRSLVKHIKANGAMKAVISSSGSNNISLEGEFVSIPRMEGLELSTQVCTETPYLASKENTDIKIAVLDLGIKSSVLKNFIDRDCQCKVFPARTSYKEMQKWKPDGYFISNGPGDPSATGYAIETVKAILKSDKPLFGICLGHQILAMAMGISTFKMDDGHRGLNYPVKNLITGKCEITSQNHGFDVNLDEVRQMANIEITHVNLIDNSVEGIRVKGKKIFSVQYYPESSDAQNTYDNFISLIKS